MNKFLFKSADADFQKLLQLTETIQKNVLYITYRVDKLLVEVGHLKTSAGLQTQVDDYFDEKETSPQTESVEQ